MRAQSLNALGQAYFSLGKGHVTPIDAPVSSDLIARDDYLSARRGRIAELWRARWSRALAERSSVFFASPADPYEPCASNAHGAAPCPATSETSVRTSEVRAFLTLRKSPSLSTNSAVSSILSTPKPHIELAEEFRLSSPPESNRHLIVDQHLAEGASAERLDAGGDRVGNVLLGDDADDLGRSTASTGLHDDRHGGTAP